MDTPTLFVLIIFAAVGVGFIYYWINRLSTRDGIVDAARRLIDTPKGKDDDG